MVQNHYVELLLELGVIGFALFACVIVGFVRQQRRAAYAVAIAAAFAVQWWFFSGYPNALHIFLILAFIYAVQASTPPSHSLQDSAADPRRRRVPPPRSRQTAAKRR